MSENDTYTKVRGLLSNIRSVRAFARETDFDLLVEMQEKLNIVIDERREDAERERKNAQSVKRNALNCFS